MRIEKYIACTKEDVDSRKFRIFIGISLGNRYFSKENVKQFILWALEKSKDDVLVLIADVIHSVNYEVLSHYSPERALRTALRKGLETREMVEKISRALPVELQRRIKICSWEEARKSQYYKEKSKFFLEEFKENKEFKNFILKIIHDNLKEKVKSLSDSELEKLANYVLDELPITLNGVEFEGKIYDFHPYPGLSGFDALLIGLQDKSLFPKLAEKLEIENKIAEVEAYIK